MNRDFNYADSDAIQSILDANLADSEKTERKIWIERNGKGKAEPFYGTEIRTYRDADGKLVEERLICVENLDDGRRTNKEIEVVHPVCHPNKTYVLTDTLPRCSAEPNEVICFECSRTFVYNNLCYCEYHYNQLKIKLARMVNILSLGMIKPRDTMSEKRVKQFYFYQNKDFYLQNNFNRNRARLEDVRKP